MNQKRQDLLLKFQRWKVIRNRKIKVIYLILPMSIRLINEKAPHILVITIIKICGAFLVIILVHLSFVAQYIS